MKNDAEIQRLHDHCNMLNAMAWVRVTGKPYFVATRQTPDGVKHFVDRRA